MRIVVESVTKRHGKKETHMSMTEGRMRELTAAAMRQYVQSSAFLERKEQYARENPDVYRDIVFPLEAALGDCRIIPVDDPKQSCQPTPDHETSAPYTPLYAHG